MFFFAVFLLLVSVSKADRPSIKTKYNTKGETETTKIRYVCPQDFHLVGRKCYHFSTNDVSWHDSHFYCITLNSSLATVNSYRELNLLRSYLNESVTDLGKYERWIDGIYDWKQLKWKWGTSGKEIKYSKFAKNRLGEKFNWHCIVLNPSKQNRWSARKCTDNRRYVCETYSDIYVEFKVYNVSKPLDIAKCSLPELLPPYERRKCLKLLGTVENNEPAYIVEKPKPTKATILNSDGFVCPPRMISLGNMCYTFSKSPAAFLDAYYECRKNKTRLAIIRNRAQDNSLRIFLNAFINERISGSYNYTKLPKKHDRWIGGVYDWKSSQWKWAMSGKPLKYKGFSKDVLKNRTSESLAWHAIFMDPTKRHSWNVDKETEKKHYICQVKAKALRKLGAVRTRPSQATISIVSKKG